MVSDALLQTINIKDIYDKFPEKRGGLKDLYDRGPANAFFLVKFWVRYRLTVMNFSLQSAVLCNKGRSISRRILIVRKSTTAGSSALPARKTKCTVSLYLRLQCYSMTDFVVMIPVSESLNSCADSRAWTT